MMFSKLSDSLLDRMSLAQWSLCLLLSLATVIMCGGQDESNTSAQYLFSSIRDLRLHQQQQQYPRRNHIQYLQAPSQQPLRQIPQDTTRSVDVTDTLKKNDQAEGGLQIQQLTPKAQPLRRVHNTMDTSGHTAEGSTAIQPHSTTHGQQAPPLELTHGELAHLYQTAVRKGNTVRLGADEAPIHAAVHHLDDDDGSGDHSNHHEGDNRGYYYYYYPLKSFMHELSSQSHSYDHDHGHDDHYQVAENSHHPEHVDYVKSHSHDSPHIYEHTHQHNVHIEPMKTDMDNDKKSKGLEPLFMAISGFIGMTVMFILSMLMMPKFGHALKSKHRTKTDDEVDVMSIVLNALDGEDCRERLACEMGKAANALNLYDNRLVKFVRRIGPVSIRRRIDKIGKYTDKKFVCASIQCKRKIENTKPKTS